MAPLIAGIVAELVSKGLPKIAEVVTQKGVDYVQDKLGVELKPQLTEAEVAQIKEQADKHEEFLIQAEVQDRANARAAFIEALRSDDPFVRRFTYYFITCWSVFAMVFIPCIIFYDVPESNVRFADTIIGFLLGTVISSMFAFLLGSSFGSRQKDSRK